MLILWQAYTHLLKHPTLFLLDTKLSHHLQKFHPLIARTKLDPASAWTQSRTLPEPPKKPSMISEPNVNYMRVLRAPLSTTSIR